jgi:hypothetical protein
MRKSQVDPTQPMQIDEGFEGTLIARTILKLVTAIPATTEISTGASGRARAEELVRAAAGKAAAVSGAMALPAGPLGLAFMIPDLLAVWRLQAQLVADVAGAFGRSGSVTREHMLYCLFRHASAQLCRGLVDQVGERLSIRRAPLRLLRALAHKLGMRLGKRWMAKGLARWLPVVGALGVAGYAYYDTSRVGRTSIELFALDPSSDP